MRPLDVTPLSLGLESATGRFVTIIPRNTTIPVQRSIEFTTVQDFQPSIQIHVLQGERAKAEYNSTLGKFVVDGIALAPRGMPRIKITFDIDINGILNVKAEDIDTGREQKILITDSGGLSKEQMNKMLQEADLYATKDALWREAGLYTKAESQVYVAEKLLDDLANAIDTDTRNKIRSCIRTLRRALINGDTQECKSHTIYLTQCLSSLLYSVEQTGKKRRNELQKAKYNFEESGEDLFKQFHVSKMLEGGMGKVYIAEERRLAVKTLKDEYSIDRGKVERFIAEALTWTKLEKHTNIVSALLVREFGGRPYLFLEYVEGGDLGQWVGRLSITQVLDIGIQICSAMDYAVRKIPGLVHRDIKPGNVLLRKDDSFVSGYNAKVTDFGLARALTEGKERQEMSDFRNTGLSRGMGTWQYMPPEQFSEDTQRQFSFVPSPVTTQADIYAFGVLLYEVLTTRLPFYSLADIFTKAPELSPNLFLQIPNQLTSLLMKCLAKRPEDRYKNFAELMQRLVDVYKEHTGESYVLRGKESSLGMAEWISKGISLNTLGQHSDAIECYEKALQLNPDSRLALVGIADSFAGLGEYEKAISYHEKAEKAGTGHWYAALAGKGYCLNRIGKYAEAVACYEEAYRTYVEQSIAQPPHYC